MMMDYTVDALPRRLLMSLPILVFVLPLTVLTWRSFEFLMWAYHDPRKDVERIKPRPHEPTGVVLKALNFLQIILTIRDFLQRSNPYFSSNHPHAMSIILGIFGLAAMPVLVIFVAECLLRLYDSKRYALKDLGLGSGISAREGNEAAEMQVDIFLPVECKYKDRFETIPLFRHGHNEFPFDKALQEYHREPIHFTLALAELNTGVFTATSTSSSVAARLFQRKLRAKRRNRDVIGQDVDEYLYEDIRGMSYVQHWRYRKAKLFEFLERRTEKRVRKPDAEAQAKWEIQYQNFYDNVRLFCKHTGSEVDDLAPPRETINNLRKHASNRRQELAPLLEENARLIRELTRYKRINAALQTRHTIEKLVFELPDTAQFDLPGSGPKWQVLWTKIWDDAKSNSNNPFHTLWTNSTGEYARNNIRDKGRDLFADMSGEIHGYDLNDPQTFDYEHFDASARRVATILHKNPIIDQNTGDVDWAQEIRKYPIAWPSADNMALTELERREARVANLQRRLDKAVAERDEERGKIEKAKADGEDVKRDREEEKRRFEVARAEVEEESGFGAFFGEGE